MLRRAFFYLYIDQSQHTQLKPPKGRNGVCGNNVCHLESGEEMKRPLLRAAFLLRVADYWMVRVIGTELVIEPLVPVTVML